MKNNKRVTHEVLSTTHPFKKDTLLSGEIDRNSENNLIGYWNDRLKGVEPLSLFTDHPRSAFKSTNKACAGFFIDETSHKRLSLFSEKHNTTLFATLLASFKVLLYRYTNQEDICVGNVVLNNEETEYFLNALPLRTELNGNDPFEVLVQRVGATITEAYQHKRLPFEKIINILGADSDLDISPLYQVMFFLQDGSELPDIMPYTVKSDLAFILNEEPSGLSGTIEYNASLYNEETILRFIDHYKQLLDVLPADPQKKIGVFSILTEAEQHQLLHEFNNTAVKYPESITIIDLFEQQAAQNPDNLALAFGKTKLTYRELNEKSNQLAHYLKTTYDIKADDLVGLLLDRSEWMLITILGVLKSGAAYVPIDPDYPEERIAYMLEDSKCKVLINKTELENIKQRVNAYSKNNLPVTTKPANLAYVIYTSGSTGKPKGVMVEHGNLFRFTQNLTDVFGFKAGMNMGALTTYTFDISVLELVCSVGTGLSVFVLDEIDPSQIISQLKQLNINIFQCTPSRLNQLGMASLSLEPLSFLDIMLIGGEGLPEKMYEELRKELPDVAIYNVYGPTEATIWSSSSAVHEGDKLNIGKPLIEEYIYMLNDHGQLMPVGIPGEIHIGGNGVTRGYLNRPELTNEKFIPDPFVKDGRIYKTGDMGRWLPDGNIECLGRIDDQVKIRGFRIELGEITSLLQKHDRVIDAVVTACAVNGTDKELIAYTTGEADADELNDYLKGHLPVYMVPVYYMRLEAIPLTSNGKVNKKVLPLPIERYHKKQDSISAAETATQKTLVNIWRSLLDIDQIGIDDDFFDLGGTSIMAPKAINLVNEETQARLSLSSLYHLRTIRELAHKIDTNTTGDINPVVLLKQGEGTPLFIFPPWSSYPTIFDEFVNEFKGKNPLYGILYTEDSDDFPFKTVQGYCRYIIEHMKALSPSGPYGLIGYSMGARTILEVALQLQQASDKVALLCAISHFPAYPSKGLLSNRKVLDEIRIFNSINCGLKFQYLYRRLPRFLSLMIKGDHNAPEIVVEIDSQKMILAVHDEYETDLKYNGDIVLIYETNPGDGVSQYKNSQIYRNSILGKLWGKYTTGKVITRIVECNHIDFFKKPAVEEVASIVETYLK